VLSRLTASALRESGATFRLPWAAGPSVSADCLVSATETYFARFRDMPGATVAALRLRRAFRSMPGAIGVSLAMRPLQRRSWSISAWETEADLRRFLHSAAHRATVRRYRPHVTVRSDAWRVDRFDLSEAIREAETRFSR